MKAVWTKRAVKSLQIIEAYLLREFGETKRAEFMQEAENTTKRLEQFPGMGKEEPLLAHRSKEYHSYLIPPTRLSKIVYYVEMEQIVIADVWDTRREPKKVTRGL